MATAKQRAWRKEFARRYGGKKKKGGKKSKGGGRTAKKKNGNGTKQGVMSWGSSVIAWVIALSNPIARVVQAMNTQTADKWAWFGDVITADYTGFCPGLHESSTGYKTLNMETGSFDWHRMIRGYGPIAGGVVFKKGFSYMQKVAPVKSLIPRIGM